MTTPVTGDLPAEQEAAGPEPATATSQSASPAAGTERVQSRPATSPILATTVGRIPVLASCPSVDCRAPPGQAVVGEPVPITATVFREGHDAVAAECRAARPRRPRLHPVPMTPAAPGTDR